MSSKTTKKMSDADKECDIMSAHLPIIKSAEENSFIWKLLHVRGKKWAWLGLQRRQSYSEFYWIDGTPLAGNYDSWKNGEPSNNYEEDCAYISADGSTGDAGGWNDIPCEIAHEVPFVCERAF